MYLITHTQQNHTPWNKGKLIGQKPPLKLKEIWAIRIRLQLANRIRDLALFNLAIDSLVHRDNIIKKVRGEFEKEKSCRKKSRGTY